MKSKRLLPLILCLSLLAPASLSAQETKMPPPALPGSLTKYGFIVGKLYLGEVADLYLDEALKATQPLIEDELKKAWNEGYKAGLLEAAPGAAYWQEIAREYQDAAKAQARGPSWGTVVLTGLGGLLIGAAGMGIAALILAR